MATLEFTDEELAALKEMIEDWIYEGFTTPPYKPAVASVIEKLGDNNQRELHKTNGELANTIGAENQLMRRALWGIVNDDDVCQAGHAMAVEALHQLECPEHPTGREVDEDGKRVCSTCGR